MMFINVTAINTPDRAIHSPGNSIPRARHCPDNSAFDAQHSGHAIVIVTEFTKTRQDASSWFIQIQIGVVAVLPRGFTLQRTEAI